MTAAVDLLSFIVLPYAAAAVCVIATLERYSRHGFSITSGSSQFLENRLHFWAMVPFHAGILIVLLGHLVAFLVPRGVLAWNAVPWRLLVLEAAAFAGGLLALGGFAAVIVRRLMQPALRRGTQRLDWVMYAVLAIQLATGVALAVVYPWGSSWFAVAAAPYLWSLVTLQPDMTLVAAMPLLARAHIAGTWVLLALFAFSRLVHVIAVPNPYLWRAPQVVRWYRRSSVPAGRKS
jgi:nitrate reductase gamma subunit